MKIYTKKGDAGFTSTITGEAIKKSDLLIELQGTIDEVNAGVGFLRSLLTDQQKVVEEELREVQYTLFRMGTDVSYLFEKQLVTAQDTAKLEAGIDKIMAIVGQQSSFLYYSGCQAASYAQVLRAVSRRAERCFVRAFSGKDYPEDGRYLNRLADYIYALARYLNYLAGQEEEKMVLRED